MTGAAVTAPEFAHRFENAEVLAELLAIAGSPLSPDEVLQRFRAGRAEGAASSEVIPTLFPGPPRFPHPDVARRLFQNLLGLWDVSGIPDFQLVVDPAGAGRARPRKVAPPGPPGDRRAGCRGTWRRSAPGSPRTDARASG